MKIAIICGGPSKERGISINSARSLIDHLSHHELQIFYVDYEKRFYQLEKQDIYSNTPEDFDFKLKNFIPNNQIFQKILKQFDIVFPAIHGKFGEDGELQRELEKHNIPFIGSSSTSCYQMYHKHIASKILYENNFLSIPSILINSKTSIEKIKFFLNIHQKCIIKPTAGGSSIGVKCIQSYQELINYKHEYSQDELIIEPFLQGKEFTIIIIENHNQEPIPLIPTEITIDDHEIFDYKRKYLPKPNTRWHTPPSFSSHIIDNIRKQAKELFKLFKAKDFVRFDGWVLNNENIVFTDFNPISGMEQNSFLFQQASHIGLTHKDILDYILFKKISHNAQNNKPILPVLFGGGSSERQVSVMSGTNVWLKLKKYYNTIPYFLDQNLNVWKLPYRCALYHTAEEIYQECIESSSKKEILNQYSSFLREKLGFSEIILDNPIMYSLDEFCNQYSYIFLALHGGIGEDGGMQKMLEEKNILYNGSDSKTSSVCIDKQKTSDMVKTLQHPKIIASEQMSIPYKNLYSLTLEQIKKHQHAIA